MSQTKLTIAKAACALLILGPSVTACGGEAPRPQPGRTAAKAPTPEPTSCPANGQLIKAVEIPAVHVAAVDVPGTTYDGHKIPAVHIPAVDLPAQRVPAQCVDVKPAPGGCLSELRVPTATIPGVTIPAAEIPGIDLPGLKIPPVHAPAVTAPSVTAPGVVAPEVCQSVPKQGGTAWGVTRWAQTRWGQTRWSVTRWSQTRWSKCNAKNECIPRVDLPRVDAPRADLPRIDLPRADIERREVGPGSEVLKGSDQIAYNLEADVLFDFGSATIKQTTALAKIAASIKKEIPANAPIQIDGHTDAKGDPTTNQRLSEQRAQAIVEWLATNGGIPRTRLRATGYGETKPTAPNTRNGTDNPEGRAKNRRVVISAKL